MGVLVIHYASFVSHRSARIYPLSYEFNKTVSESKNVSSLATDFKVLR